MKVILSYRPSCTELVWYQEGKEVLKKDCWLSKLTENSSVKFVGRDELKRIEIEMSLDTFKEIQHHPLFIMKAEDLRRLRTTRQGILDYLTSSDVNLIDNDLDAVLEAIQH